MQIHKIVDLASVIYDICLILTIIKRYVILILDKKTIYNWIVLIDLTYMTNLSLLVPIISSVNRYYLYLYLYISKCFSTQNVCSILFLSKLCTLLGPLALSFLRFLFSFRHFLYYWNFYFLNPFLLFLAILTIVIVGHWLVMILYLCFYLRSFHRWLDLIFLLDWGFLLLFFKIEIGELIFDDFSIKIFILDFCCFLFNPFLILRHLIDFLLGYIGYLFIILEQEILICIIDNNVIFIDLNLF